MSKTAIISIRAKAGKEEELKKHLTSFINPSRSEEGCLDYHIVQSSDDPRIFMGFMIYRDEEAWNRHEDSAMIQQFVNNVAPGIAEGPPEIKEWRDLG